MDSKKSVGYAIGDLGINLYFISSMTFLLYFYTDVLKISPVAAAGVLLVARVVDAFTDPIMGAIAERLIQFGQRSLHCFSKYTKVTAFFDFINKFC